LLAKLLQLWITAQRILATFTGIRARLKHFVRRRTQGHAMSFSDSPLHGRHHRAEWRGAIDLRSGPQRPAPVQRAIHDGQIGQ
jgi:hypothetical protein